MTQPSETDAARAGAEVELTTDTAGAQVDGVALDETALAAVRESLPGWDVQPFQLSRAVDVPAGTDALRTSLEQVAAEQGRALEIIMTGDHLVVRVSGGGVVGVTEQDVDVAAALDTVFSGSQATGSEPGRR